MRNWPCLLRLMIAICPPMLRCKRIMTFHVVFFKLKALQFSFGFVDEDATTASNYTARISEVQLQMIR